MIALWLALVVLVSPLAAAAEPFRERGRYLVEVIGAWTDDEIGRALAPVRKAVPAPEPPKKP